MTPPAVHVVCRDSIADVGVDDAALSYLTGGPGALKMSYDRSEVAMNTCPHASQRTCGSGGGAD
jgi:hypothetical protein